MSTGRREFLKLLSASAAASTFHASIRRALAIPASNRTGSINDVEHVVFMMQENRAFDHYFGTMRGVRGFGDPRAVTLPSGKSVFHQPDPNNPDEYVLPFRPNAGNLGQMYLLDTPHGWNDTHAAWNGGVYDKWVPNKGQASMVHLERQDLPYHYALADAFTICDAYYCSVLGATDPNRYHMWTGWVGNDGDHKAPHGPVINNAEVGYNWSTYPERLEQAGISWKIYQDVGAGLDAADFWGFTDDAFIGNFGDTSLLYFLQYQNAPGGSPLALKARTGTNILKSGTLFDTFRADILNNQLPQVSWIVAPEAYTEHGNWPSNFGAYYVSQMLDALTANPDVWSKTVFFYMFDENDGFFDHLVPPTPPRSRAEGISTVGTTNELFEGVPNSDYPPDRFVAGPYGLGVRVPMIVISPWSKGGWVNSQVSDHTSLIRFVERRFGVVEPNITAWRRAITGDLTSAFDFGSPDAAVVALPDTSSLKPSNLNRHPDYVPKPPSNQALPQQEPGRRPARALPYELRVDAQVNASGVQMSFRNTGKAGAVFQVRSGDGQTGPRTYTVGAGDATSDTFAGNGGKYDLSVYGPNGFLRSFAGGVAGGSANVAIDTVYDQRSGGIAFVLQNRGSSAVSVNVFDAYSGQTQARLLLPQQSVTLASTLEASFGWYDFTVTANSDPGFRRQLAGHVETGRASTSDPAIGA
ncbi:MAG TPA: phospholipase C, phosphocholine-specific [Candidatus Acidoferrum sp.]|nr:phospholipase C, phosphocholine-specific [Candidatus Acidoferrum sp.]